MGDTTRAGNDRERPIEACVGINLRPEQALHGHTRGTVRAGVVGIPAGAQALILAFGEVEGDLVALHPDLDYDLDGVVADTI